MLKHAAPAVLKLSADRRGFVARSDARRLGEIIRDLGGGRLTKDSVINFDVGVDWIAKPGEAVQPGSVLARIHAADRRQARLASVRLRAAFEIAASPRPARRLIAEVIV